MFYHEVALELEKKQARKIRVNDPESVLHGLTGYETPKEARCIEPPKGYTRAILNQLDSPLFANIKTENLETIE